MVKLFWSPTESYRVWICRSTIAFGMHDSILPTVFYILHSNYLDNSISAVPTLYNGPDLIDGS